MKMAKEKVRNIGIPNINLPTERCNDSRCPFHSSHVKVRGRIFEGKVTSIKPTNTAVVQWERHIFLPKYERFEKRLSKVNAHAPPCMHVKKDDTVTIGECRPLSKTKKFVVIKNVKK
jgi:small subunit ribosomal protein S17